MTFHQFSRCSLGFSALLLVLSIAVFVYPGPKFSIEFTGGTLMQIELPADKTRDDVAAGIKNYEMLTNVDLGNVTVNAVKTATEDAILLRLRPMSNDEHLQLLEHLKGELGDIKELKYNTIGPSLSASLKAKSFQAIGIASLVVIVYLALAFRKLPRRLNPWKFGILAVIGFIHDVVITAGVFTALSQFTNFEFDTLFVTALLTILAYSAIDTIVIFDRVRGNLSFENRNEDLSTVVSAALRQCIRRTLGTSVSTLIMLFALLFLGAESIRWFILALIFGIVIGAYSSYFVAAPLLVFWQKSGNR